MISYNKTSIILLYSLLCFFMLKSGLILPFALSIGPIFLQVEDFFIIALFTLTILPMLFGRYSLLFSQKYMFLFLTYIFIYFIFSLRSFEFSRVIDETRDLSFWLVLPFACASIKNKRDIVYVYRIIIYTISLFCFVYIYTYFNQDFVLNSILPERIEERLSLSVKLVLATIPVLVSASLIPNSIISKQKATIFLAVFTFVIFLSGSRAALIILIPSIVIQYCYILYKSKKKNLFPILIIVFIISGFFYLFIPTSLKERFIDLSRLLETSESYVSSLHSLYSRMTSYELIWSKIKQSPLFGYGIGARIHTLFFDEFSYYVDSSYLIYWFKLGIGGLFFITYIIFNAIKKSFHNLGNYSKDDYYMLNLSVFFSLTNLSILAIQDSLFYFNYTIVIISVFIATIHKAKLLSNKNHGITDN